MSEGMFFFAQSLHDLTKSFTDKDMLGTEQACLQRICDLS